ncbi:hypothetical protein WA026_016510 [Henosepilachna vigintioctopunctata]|uniref:Peptidase A2 domain-containing protein n=2 Tax=Henosepilachna vigintioctopunctata TaxID=420089 RepID=A0AAW1VFH3_9CUCU
MASQDKDLPHEDLELDYELESDGSEAQVSNTKKFMARLLKDGLAESIQNIVASETAKALEKFKMKSGESISNNMVSNCSSSCSVSRTRAGGEILEPFDPDSKDCNILKWINKIDQLGEIHEWSDYERAYFMQSKLQGGARTWYNRLDNYNLTWDHWKSLLHQAFPREHDFVQLLREMLARVKMEGETMTHYYHSKLALIQRCDIKGTKAISCLIDGLPQDLKANARAFQCNDVSELYTGFLSSFDRFDEASTSGYNRDLKRRNSKATIYPRTSKMLKTDVKHAGVSGVIRCFNCQEYGTHISRNCPKVRAERCMICGNTGHDRFACPRRGEKKAIRRDTNQVRMVDVVNSTYKKRALLDDGTTLKIYIDTGSERNILTEKCFNALQGNFQVRPLSLVLKGFGGALCTVRGEIDLPLTVDGANFIIKAVIANCDLAGADLLLGQPALATPGVTLTVHDGKAKITCEERPEDIIRRISLDENDMEGRRNRRVLLLDNVTLAPGEEAEVPVVVEGAQSGEQCFLPARRFEVNGAIIVNRNQILEGGHSEHIHMQNVGDCSVQWKTRQVVARAMAMDTINKDGRM